MPLSKRRLLLFDIDGTLITSGGAGEGALMDAMQQRFGIEEDLDGITIAGATDALIARMMLEKNGLAPLRKTSPPCSTPTFPSSASGFRAMQAAFFRESSACSMRLRKREDCVVALLTGNLVRGAEIKLSHYGVWDYFRVWRLRRRSPRSQ